jgi:AraC-like DNA-binding protein
MAWSRVLTFTDPLPCQTAILSADVEILRTSKDNFRAEITQVGADSLWSERFHVSSSQIIRSICKPGRQSIAFLTESNSSTLQHCGIEVSPGDIIIDGYEVVHRTSGPCLDYASISLTTEELDSLAASCVGKGLVKGLTPRIVHPRPELMSRLLAVHKVVGHLAQETPKFIEAPEVFRALKNTLLHVMIRCLVESTHTELSTGGRRYEWIIAKLEDFLAANPDRPIYLTEVCSGIGVAERTLRAACEEHLGMGPIRYLTLRRMHLVRRALLGAESKNANVTSIVTDHGFQSPTVRSSENLRRRRCVVPRSNLRFGATVPQRLQPNCVAPAMV